MPLLKSILHMPFCVHLNPQNIPIYIEGLQPIVLVLKLYNLICAPICAIHRLYAKSFHRSDRIWGKLLVSILSKYIVWGDSEPLARPRSSPHENEISILSPLSETFL